MSQTERLREALLEIEVLRKREQESLRETQALLEVLQITTSGDSPDKVIAAALVKTAEAIDAERVALCRLENDEIIFDLSSDRVMQATAIPVDTKFFLKPRNISDVERVPKLAGLRRINSTSHRSFLILPVKDGGVHTRVLIAAHSKPQHFSNRSLDFLKRLIQLTAQALRNSELRTQNALLAAVIDGSSSGFAIADATDAQLPLVFVNSAFEELTGYPAEEVLGQNCRFLSAEPVESEERQRLRHAVEDRTSGRFLIQNVKKNGDLFWNDLSLFPVFDATGDLAQMVATQTDATERVQAERERQAAQTRLQDALAHTRDAFLLILKDGTVGFSNSGTREMFPCKVLDWAEGTSFEANWTEYVNSLPRSLGELPAGLLTPDFDPLCQQDKGTRASLPDGRQVLFRAEQTQEGTIVVSATDTTSIRNTERLLRQRAAAVENANDGIGILDDDGRIIYANRSLSSVLGYAKEAAVLGRKWATHYQTPLNQDQFRAEFALADNAQILQLKLSAGAKQFHEITRTDVEKVGDIIVIRDISNAVRNRQNLAELNKQMNEAQRREVIADLAAGLAHDFNNVLSAISGSAMLISTDPDVDQTIQGHAERISKAGSTAARLVNRMLDLATTDDDAAVFDLRAVLGEVKELAAVNLSKKTTFSALPGPVPFKIRAVISDITLVILNLVINASDALLDGHGEISVSIDGFSQDPSKQPLFGEIKPNQPYAKIVVTDTGEGISDDVLPNILKQFFTTKGSRGTGAGLAMVTAIVGRLDGAIFVSSKVGDGTTFEVVLPTVTENPDEPHSYSSQSDLSGKTYLVLGPVDNHRAAMIVAQRYQFAA